jgi:Xaa-Pro aminopeptidase
MKRLVVVVGLGFGLVTVGIRAAVAQPATRRAPPPRAAPATPVLPSPAPAGPAGDAPIDPYAPTAPTAPIAPTAPNTDAGPAEPSPIPRRVGLADVTAVQGLLAVQRLDGWLLFDRDGENPIAVRLVAPEGHPTRPWFYMIPARGKPVALVHTTELRSFDHLAGEKLTYQGYRDLDKQLRAMLKGVKSVAVEYSAKAAVPSVSRVDAGTLEVIRAAGVQVKSSDTLVQFTKAIWGDAGRTAHYVAVHHVVELRKEALAFVVKQLQSGAPVTEYDVQQRLVRGMTMRGLVGTPPVVAAGVNTADPYYVPSADKAAAIKRGDLIVISLAAKLDKPEGIYAVQTWCAIADTAVPEPIAKAFETVSLARDQAMGLIGDRARKHRPITGRLHQEGRVGRPRDAPHRPLDRQRPAGRRRRPRRLRGQGLADPHAGHRVHRRPRGVLPRPVRRARRDLGLPRTQRSGDHDAGAGRRRGPAQTVVGRSGP